MKSSVDQPILLTFIKVIQFSYFGSLLESQANLMVGLGIYWSSTSYPWVGYLIIAALTLVHRVSKRWEREFTERGLIQQNTRTLEPCSLFITNEEILKQESIRYIILILDFIVYGSILNLCISLAIVWEKLLWYLSHFYSIHGFEVKIALTPNVFGFLNSPFLLVILACNDRGHLHPKCRLGNPILHLRRNCNDCSKGSY